MQIGWNMGWRYFQFRVGYEFKRRTGLLKKKFPANPPVESLITLSDWSKSTVNFLFNSRKEIKAPKKKDIGLKTDFNRILNGEICFFSAVWYDLSLNYDWVTNPESNYRYEISKHWTEVEDLNEKEGDIKYVWEKARFSYLLKVMRYDYHFDEDHSEFVFQEIEGFIKHNPLNQGPNYKCSQEISVRVLNWLLLLHFYKDSKYLTDEFFIKISHWIRWQMQHVFDNINFSRIAVRNNHTITETATLFIVGTLFPSFPKSKIWQKKGLKWLEQEVNYQIYDDGTYLQFSHNYHRVVIQNLTYAIAIANCNDITLSDSLIRKCYKSIDFLYQCQDLTSGKLSNYGSNDGALFFKLNNSDYRDYRPQLDALHYLITGNNLYKDTFEDRLWFCSRLNIMNSQLPQIVHHNGILSFPIGGIYLMRDMESLTVFVCTKYKDRPAHSDGLHIDIWYKGENLLFDAGTYKYNTSKETIHYFSGTESHNTVMLDNYDQMLKGPRFIWLKWIKLATVEINEDKDTMSLKSEIDAFSYINKNIRIERTLLKRKNCPEWEITDVVKNKPSNLKLVQHWHTNFSNFTFHSNGIFTESIGFISNYYGTKDNCRQISFYSIESEIKTTLSILTK